MISFGLVLVALGMCAIVYCSWPSDTDKSWRYRWNYLGMPTIGLIALARVVGDTSISFDINFALKSGPVMLFVVALFAPALRAARETRNIAS